MSTTLRWLTMIPGGLLAALLAGGLAWVLEVLRRVLATTGLVEANSDWWVYVFTSVLMSWFFVRVGTGIAPRPRVGGGILVALSALYSLATSAGMLLTGHERAWWYVLGAGIGFFASLHAWGMGVQDHDTPRR